MRTEAFPINSILGVLREDVLAGVMTIRSAAEMLHEAGWTNYVDISGTRRLLHLETCPPEN